MPAVEPNVWGGSRGKSAPSLPQFMPGYGGANQHIGVERVNLLEAHEC